MLCTDLPRGKSDKGLATTSVYKSLATASAHTTLDKKKNHPVSTCSIPFSHRHSFGAPPVLPALSYSASSFFPPLSLMSSQCKSRKSWWRPEGLLEQRWEPKLLSDTINASISKKGNISEVRGQLRRSNPCRYLPASIYMPSIIDSTQKEPFPRSEFLLGCIWTYWILVDRQIQPILNKVLELQIV